MIYEMMAQPRYDRIVPLEEVAQNRMYSDLADLAVIFNHEVIAIEDRWFWKPNVLISWIKRYGPYRPFHGSYCQMESLRGQVSLNDLFDDLQQKCFSVEEWVKFYMQIGYAFGGFCEIMEQRLAKEFPQCVNLIEDETLLSYLLRIHDGKILKL